MEIARSLRLFAVFLPMLFVVPGLAADRGVLDYELQRQSGEAVTKIVFIGDGGGHGSRGNHEFVAGSILLARQLNRAFPNVHAVVHSTDNWPDDLRHADAIIVALNHARRAALDPEIFAAVRRGAGFMAVHFGVEVEKGEQGNNYLRWLGGYFETFWSVNPWWKPNFASFPEHPITRGVKPFSVRDEWYYHMRFVGDMQGVTPILTDVPPLDSLKEEPSSRGGNQDAYQAVAQRKPQHMAWAYERPDGGRGFGFTGMHLHNNLANDGFRTILLNAAAWVAKLEVPAEGVPSKAPTASELDFVVDQSRVMTQKHRVYDIGKRPADSRLAPPKDLNGYFPFHVPVNKQAWEQRAEELRRRVLVATGLWPLPERTPLNPVIHGKVQREGFTVEKVYFESIPNHFVTGLLFRPDDGHVDVQRPAVLCPHGHGGRLQDHGPEKILELIADGEENFESSGRFPKIARCAHLARMGCVVLIYDMLGYADSQQISYQLAHRFAQQRADFEGTAAWGLYSAQAEMRLQSIMGVQTWNSVRCLDFLEQLPDVDGSRLAVTGGSGGGTQTILLCAIDSRPITAFPNGMVSTAMQGGCTCENCSLLRVGTGNVELAALFAPKPQAMTAADDWTVEMLTKGYPELQELYQMVGSKENVYCRDLRHFPHNYNYVSRATMYQWFNKHLGLGWEHPVLERDFPYLTQEEQSVWNEQHPKPTGGDEYERALTKYLAETSDKQIASLVPRDAQRLGEYRRVVGGALQTLIGRSLAPDAKIERTKQDKVDRGTYLLFEDIIRDPQRGEELPVLTLYPTSDWNGRVVVWVDGRGKLSLFSGRDELREEVQQLIQSGTAVISGDLFQQGEFWPSEAYQRVVDNPREAPAYTFGYNHSLFARRVHDIFSLIAYVSNYETAPEQIQLVGVNGGGPVVAAARALAGDAIAKTVVDTKGFRFGQIRWYRHANFLPGIVKYGDLPALLALAAPHPLRIIGEEAVPEVTAAAYSAAGARDAVETAAEFVSWLTAP